MEKHCFNIVVFHFKTNLITEGALTQFSFTYGSIQSSFTYDVCTIIVVI